jgi:hypothetical protein
VREKKNTYKRPAVQCTCITCCAVIGYAKCEHFRGEESKLEHNHNINPEYVILHYFIAIRNTSLYDIFYLNLN